MAERDLTYPVAVRDDEQTGGLAFAGETDALLIPKGTTGQRPGSPSNGMIRYNETTNQFEGYENGSWQQLGSVASIDPEAAFASENGGLLVPSGTTGERPDSTAGMIRYNETLGQLETYNSATGWTTLGDPESDFVSQSGALLLPSGTTAERPSPTPGMLRYNESNSNTEVYQGGQWSALATGALAIDPETAFAAENGALLMPSGTTGQRPTPTNGMMRYNETTSRVEMYQNSVWVNVDSTGQSDGTFFGMPVFIASDITGATDVSDELLDFMLAHDGETIFIPAGIYQISIDSFGTDGEQPSANQRTFKIFALPGTVIFTWPANDYCIRWTGRAQSGFNDREEDIISFAEEDLPGSSDDLTTRIEVGTGNAADYIVGEWVMIRGNMEPEQDGNAGDIMDSYAECARIAAIDTVNDYLHLDRRLYITYVSNGGVEPSVVRMPQGLEGTDVEASIYGINFDSLDADPQGQAGTQIDTVEIRAVPNVHIEACNFRRCFRAALVLRTCPGAIIRNITVDDLPNDTSGSHLGYGLNLMCATADALVENYHVGKCRHGFTTGGAVEPTRVSFYERWDQFGFPTNCVITNFSVFGANGSALDCHAEGIGLHFKNCTVQFPNRGDGSQDSQGRGMYVRSGDVIIEGYTQIGGSAGITFSTRIGYTGHKIRHTINGATIANLAHDGDPTDAGAVKCEDDNAFSLGSEHYREYSFNNVVVRDCAKGFDAAGDCNVIFNGYTTERVNFPFELGANAVVFAAGVSCSYRGMSGVGPFDVAVLTAGSSMVISDLVLYKGPEADLPEFVFDGAGSYKLGRLTEYNPDSVTQTKISDGLTRITAPVIRIVEDLTHAPRRPRISTGRYTTNNNGSSSVGSGNANADTVYYSPVYLLEGETYTHFAIATDTVSGGAYKVGVYASGPGGLPIGTPIFTATSGSITTAALTNQDIDITDWTVPETGWYWLAVLPSVTGTVGLTSTFSGVHLFGATDMTAVSARLTSAEAYANGLPNASTETLSFGTGAAPNMGLKAA